MLTPTLGVAGFCVFSFLTKWKRREKEKERKETKTRKTNLHLTMQKKKFRTYRRLCNPVFSRATGPGCASLRLTYKVHARLTSVNFG